MQKKDILGNYLSKSFLFTCSMRTLDGEYEGYSALQSFLPGTRELYVEDGGAKMCLSGEGYKWLTYLPMHEAWALMVFYNPEGELIRWYFDISKRNYLDEDGMPYRDDIFLDLIVLPDGTKITKDADELQKALDGGEITVDDYNHAYKIRDRIVEGEWSDVDMLTALSNKLISDYSMEQAVEKETEYIIAARRHLHENPEVSYHEYETAAYIENQLKAFGVAVRRLNKTGVIGEIEGGRGQGRTVLLRADIDALPIEEETDVPYRSKRAGAMHACGHDAHTAALLGAAKILQTYRGNFAGRVLLVFQHAEEVGRGAQFFLDEHVEEGVDRAFGIHILPGFPAGVVAMTRGADAAACDFFTIGIKGKAAHVSKPHQGIDAAYIAARIAVELKALVPGLVDPMETALVGIGKITAGSAYNIIAEEAKLEGTIRAFSNETQSMLREKIKAFARSMAKSHGGTADVMFDHTTSVIINDDEAFNEVYAVACGIVGQGRVITDSPRLMGLAADDFSEFLRKIKGVYVHVGTAGESPDTQNPLHSCRFDIDERALTVMTRLHVEYVLSVLAKDKA